MFSSDHKYYGTQFLLKFLVLREDETAAIDLASGNGVIGRAIQHQKPEMKLHLVDDSFLAVGSSKLNLDPVNTTSH